MRPHIGRGAARALAAVALAAAAGGCAATLNHPHHSLTATPGADGVQHVKVTTHTFWFEPDEIVVQANVPVDLEIHNNSLVVPHNFTLHTADGEIEVDVGIFKGTGHMTFTPKTPGTYHFHCDKDKHGSKGMTGTFIVR